MARAVSLCTDTKGGLELGPQVPQQRPGACLAHLSPSVGRFSADLGFDGEQLGHTRQASVFTAVFFLTYWS